MSRNETPKRAKFSLQPSDRARLKQFKASVIKANSTALGFPLAKDLDYADLADFLAVPILNIGDAFKGGAYRVNTMEAEREVVRFYAELFRAPPDDYWGYITSGGTESNLSALYLGRTLHPKGVMYFSAASHYGVPKAAHLLRTESEIIKAQPSGEIDYDDFQQAVRSHKGKAAIVCANIGTTMTEAKDNVQRLKEILTDEKVPHFIHCDAALAGIPLSFQEPHWPFDFADGADSICFSGHKFPGAPYPCGLELTKRSHRDRSGNEVSYIGSTDTTITGSRSGLAVLALWYATKRFGLKGFRERTLRSLELADYAEQELRAMNWAVKRNPQSFTVVLAEPPTTICEKYQLASEGGWSHIICMPGTTRALIDEFLAELKTAA